jgi:hypothetical protein
VYVGTVVGFLDATDATQVADVDVGFYVQGDDVLVNESVSAGSGDGGT